MFWFKIISYTLWPGRSSHMTPCDSILRGFFRRHIQEQSAGAHARTHTHTHTLLNRQARRTAIYERELQKGFWRNFQSRNQLCLKIQAIYLQLLLQHAVLHYSQFIPRFSMGSYFSVLQIRGVVPRINITQTLAVDRNVQMVRRLRQVFEPYRMWSSS
jgi:hypothetical protein